MSQRKTVRHVSAHISSIVTDRYRTDPAYPSGIVITDLDSSEDEADSPLQTFADCDSIYSVSNAFLSRVNATKISIPILKSLPPKLESDSSQALVLFRPSPWSAKDARELERIYHERDDSVSERQVEPQIEEPETDAMEIE